MKFTLSWLKKFLDTNASLNEIADNLTNLGFEVEEIIDRSAELADFEVAKILKTNKHPDADKLKVCEVETSEGVVQIVCGAGNARSGITVVLARPGVEIPNGRFKIKESTIRGVKSQGMLCSFDELLLENESGHDGIIELPDSAKVGENILSYLGIDDPVIVINVTPNRGDVLGVYGIARELAAKGVGMLRPIESVIPAAVSSRTAKAFRLERDPGSSIPASPGVAFLDSRLRGNDTALFTNQKVNNITNHESPAWLKKLLTGIGVAPISAVVDITNYITYSFNQPMHAYDADKLTGELKVEPLDNVTKFKALNGREYELQTGDAVVRDESAVHCLAGIIGGEDSSCTYKTKNIVLEAACFDADTIAKTGRRLQIDSASRYRFERKVDQGFTLQALQMASRMVLEICGGKAGDIIVRGNDKVQDKYISLDYNHIERIAGFKIPTQDIDGILTNLGFIIDNDKIKIPSWRHDINIPEDIAEEVIRVYGYDKVPQIPLPSANVAGILHKEHKISLLKRTLSSQGYDEVISWSFMDSAKASLFTSLQEELFLLNPIASDLNYMRPSIIPNLLGFTAGNLARSIKDLAFYELGPVFPSRRQEVTVLNGIRCGFNMPKNCHEKPRTVDIFDIKADLTAVLDYFNLPIEKCRIQPANLAYYHPTRSATLSLGKDIIANFGEIHPRVLKSFEIEQRVTAFELYIENIPENLSAKRKNNGKSFSNFQAVARDYAFVVDNSIAVGDILSYVGSLNKQLIKSVDLFDIYTGPGLEEGKKSIAISVIIQSDERTLTEQDLSELSRLIIDKVSEKFAATLRI